MLTLYFTSLKSGGNSHLRELEMYGMNKLNISKTICVAECKLGYYVYYEDLDNPGNYRLVDVFECCGYYWVITSAVSEENVIVSCNKTNYMHLLTYLLTYLLHGAESFLRS